MCHWETSSKLVYSMFVGLEPLKAEDAPSFYNEIFIKTLEVEEQQLRGTGVVLHSSKNQRLVHHLVSNGGRIIFKKLCLELDTWIGWWPAFCDFHKRKSYFDWLPAA